MVRVTGDDIARRMRFACWIIKATHTDSHMHTRILTICKIYCFCSAPIVGRTRLYITSHDHCLSSCHVAHIQLFTLIYTEKLRI